MWAEGGRTGALRTALALLCLGAAPKVPGWQWQTTELHYQRGRLAAPVFAGGARSDTRILTLQHASGWGFGDVFAFVDFLDDADNDGFNDTDTYGELYVNFSLGKLAGERVGAGPLADVGLLAGVNYSRDAEVLKWLPGVRLSWDAPGFAFLNTDFTLYLDDSEGVAGGGAPAEDDSYMVDVNWAYPFQVDGHRFSIEGHGEYIGERTNEFGQPVHDWVLLQPQFRYDLGHGIWHAPDRLFVGAEWQYWRNKLGDGGTDDNVLQALVVLRL
ncbi:MAG TPA: outer membrane protein OmpK [Gammaproteobacteria bacterium]|nr:outer membrane protein OmpK [Gammaproteobacteria bacterium]